MFRETGHTRPLLLNYTTWGSSNFTLPPPGFSNNGGNSENSRVLDTGPFGKMIPVWRTMSQGGNADGGWNSAFIPTNQNSMYRMTVFFKREVATTGSFYFGLNGNLGVLPSTGGGANTNPYFSIIGVNDLLVNVWYMAVAYVWPAGTTSRPAHEDSGIYVVATGEKVRGCTDFIQQFGNNQLRHRTYLYYTTIDNQILKFAYPRIDLIDGYEVSTDALLAGHDSIAFESTSGNNGQVVDPFKITNDLTVNSLSELGITAGLYRYFRFDNSKESSVFGNTTPFLSDTHVNNYRYFSLGKLPAIEIASASGHTETDYIKVPQGDLRNVGCISFKFKLSTGRHNSHSSWGLLTYGIDCFISATKLSNEDKAAILIRGNGTNQLATSGVVNLDEISTLSVNLYPGGIEVFLNGIRIAGSASNVVRPPSGYTSSLFIGYDSKGPVSKLHGLVSDLKIFLRRLTPEEMAIEHNYMIKPLNVTQTGCYISGELVSK